MNPPIDARAIGAALQVQPRERSYLLAQILQQMNQPRPNPQSYGSLAAQLGGAFLDQQTMNREAQAQQAQQQQQAQALAQALGQYQQQAQGGMQSLPGTGVQLDTLPDPSGARQQLMGSLVQNQNPMAQGLASQLMGQMLAPPPEPVSMDLGDKIALRQGSKIVGEFPKSVTPDARMREEGDQRRFEVGESNENARFKAGEMNEFARLQMRLAQDQDTNRRADARQLRADTASLRGEFNKLPEVVAYKDVLPIVESIKSAPDTPAGDLDYVYGIAKVMDPGSAVREGEFGLILDSRSPLAKIFGTTRLNFAGKGKLDPNTRQKLQELMDNRLSQLQTAYDTSRNQYALLGGKLGADSYDVVGEHFGDAFGNTAQAPTSGATQIRRYNPQTGKIE